MKETYPLTIGVVGVVLMSIGMVDKVNTALVIGLALLITCIIMFRFGVKNE